LRRAAEFIVSGLRYGIRMLWTYTRIMWESPVTTLLGSVGEDAVSVKSDNLFLHDCNDHILRNAVISHPRLGQSSDSF
jgi:hypothetical protein